MAIGQRPIASEFAQAQTPWFLSKDLMQSSAINPFFKRLTLLTGIEAAVSLERCAVIVFGLGGVGSWCAEALVRSGIGNISLVDSDTVSVSNINRQVQATTGTIGLLKAGAMEDRLKSINPSCVIKAFPMIFSRETAELFGISGADYVIDAIDTLKHKLDLIEAALAAGTSGTKIFSSMGMAQKLDPTLIKAADIWDTRGCPLARLVRQGLRKRGISTHFTAVYSPERLPPVLSPRPADISPEEPDSVFQGWDSGRKVINGSAVTVTAAAGMVLASLVIRDVCAGVSQPGLRNGRYE